MSLAQKISVMFMNSAGVATRAGAVAVVNKGGSKSTVTITRPANATAYAAGKVVGQADTVTPANAGTGILEFQAVGPLGGAIRINSADLRVDLAAVPSGMTSFTLHLYDAAPDAVLDNAAWDLVSAGDRGKYLGSIALSSPADLGSTLFCEVNSIGKQVNLKDGLTSLFGVLVSATGFTPASAGVFAVRLHATEL